MGFFYPEWQKIIRIDITNPPSTTGYQVKVEIPWQPGMKDDFSDLRFSDYLRTLPYWIETSTTRSTASVWVKLTEINAACQEYFCYYGNGGASSESSGTAVFDLFDDFLGSSVNTDLWNTGGSFSVSNSELVMPGHATTPYVQSKVTYGVNYASRSRMKDSNYAAAFFPQHGFSVGNPGVFTWTNAAGTAMSVWVRDAGAGGRADMGSAFPSNSVYYTWNLIRNGTTSGIGSIDTIGTGTRDTEVPAGSVNFYLAASGAAGHTTTIDWTLIRKYQSTEPTCTPAAYGINTAFYQGYLERAYLTAKRLILTAAQHLTHIDLSWTEE